jgi:hypothetical protein
VSVVLEVLPGGGQDELDLQPGETTEEAGDQDP